MSCGPPDACGSAPLVPVADCSSVAISVKMEIRILEARIRFLREKNALTSEIEEMISSLLTVVPRAPTTSQRKAPMPTTQVLQTPQTFTGRSEYVGIRYQNLVIQPGDHVAVYAWTDGQQRAIAYNRRSDMAGEIPARFLEPVEPQPATSSEICVFFSSRNGKFNYRVGDLTWGAGDYIRICKWDSPSKNSGHGFNLATMGIGRFVISPKDFKVVRA